MKVLLAGVPTPYRGRPLNGVIQEVERLHAVFKDLAVEILLLEPEDDAFKAVPAGAGASVQCILDRLPSITIMHLASHGEADAQNMFNSGFIMRDGLLTLDKLLTVKNPASFLAFLSACDTANADLGRFEPVSHLGMVLAFGTFKSVVGTLWYVDTPIFTASIAD